MVEVTSDDLAPVAYLQLKKLWLQPKSPVSSGQLFLFPSINSLFYSTFLNLCVLQSWEKASQLPAPPPLPSHVQVLTTDRQSKSQNMYRKFVFVSSLCRPIVIPTRILAHVGDIVMSLRKDF